MPLLMQLQIQHYKAAKMIINILRKELKSMFASPMGWVILALLMLAFGMNFLNGIDSYFAVIDRKSVV